MSTAGQADVRGLRTCGSVWACPRCSAWVWAERERELTHLFRAAHATGLQVGFITLTMRHHSGQTLAELWHAMAPALEDAWGRGSRAVRRLRDEMGVVGIVRRVQSTHGKYGWHLHPHLVVFAENADAADFDRLREAMFAAWSARLVRAGMEAPSDEHGLSVKVLDITHAAKAASRYVTIAGSFRAAAELTDRHGRSARKGNRTTWELLDAAMQGDARAARLWREWEGASRGRRAWAYSAALRGLAQEHPELVDEPREEPDVFVNLTEQEWKAVRRDGHTSRLLTAAENAYRCGVRKKRRHA